MTSDVVDQDTPLRAAGRSSRRRFLNRVVAGGITASAASAFLAATGAASNVAGATSIVPPSAVRSLTAAPGASGQVRLAWLAPSAIGGAAITDYIIQRSTTGTNGWTTINDGVHTTTSYVVGGLTNGVASYFRVLARNAAGNGAPSNVANAVPRSVPSAPTLHLSPRPRGALLTWTTPATGGSPITRYVIQRSTSATTGWATINSSKAPPTRSLAVGGLHDRVRYYFRMTALNAAGTGPWSPVVSLIAK